jgi:hypothetical protein
LFKKRWQICPHTTVEEQARNAGWAHGGGWVILQKINLIMTNVEMTAELTTTGATDIIRQAE